MANKHTIIVLASIVVIASSIGYSSLNLISASALDFKWATKNFDFLALMYGGKMQVCNPSDYSASFTKYEFSVLYDSKHLGTFTVPGAGIAPHSKAVVSGKFEADDKQVAQIFFTFLDTEVKGTDVARIDGSKMQVLTTLDYSVMGLIPFSTSHEYSGQEFLKIMNQDTKC